MKVRIEREPFLRPEGIGPGGDRGDERVFRWNDECE
jgi:hypothetical protein